MWWPPMGEPLLEVTDLNVWFESGGTDPRRRVPDAKSAISGLNVWFDETATVAHVVRDVSFSLERGERIGLVGESGCGKTTALLALMGLLPPNATLSGRVMLDGVDLLCKGEESVAPHRWKDVAMVFQGAMNAFNPVRRIGAQLVEPMELHRTHRGVAARQRACELLDLVGIPPQRFDSFPHELSGGQRQRAAIAMALACEPKLLLADEPTTALDVIVQAQVLDLLAQLSDQLGLAVVLVTHDLPLVSGLCHRTAVMYAGQVAELGTSATIVADPQHPYTRMLFAATPEIDGEGAIASIPGTPPRLDRQFTGCAFAPRCDVSIAACNNGVPALVADESRHQVRCIRAGARP
jgi:peptide/nickel transport system ATP-binding protein